MADNKPELLVQPILDFLHVETPKAWLVEAKKQEELLLLDHAHCEKKAASSALSMIYRYVDKQDLLLTLSQLAREELLHFEQVLNLIEKRGFHYGHLSAGTYASSLHKFCSKEEPQRLIDTLIIGAIIEARSCERFYALRAFVDEELAQYYQFLLKSESRHFQDYLDLAIKYSASDIDERVQFFLEKEKQLIESESEVFRFHSGVPV